MSIRKPSRRTFLRTVVVTAGAASIAPSLLGCESPRDPSEVFPQSVASGDPRESSIVLWTRVAADGDASVRLEMSTDERFASLISLSSSEFDATAEHDHCVRVKVEGLEPGTTYYYRFGSGGSWSRTGRFRTAAASGADVPVRFAVLSCQDFVGRWYNSLTKLLEPEQDDLDFVVHLGDYVYETTGDPSFMMASPDRQVTLTDTAGAIAMTEEGQTFYAARSLDNYRELYRTYRSDAVLQAVHEKFAFLVIWDDHEFSDDCWQDVATYTGGRQDEKDTERRRNAEQAFLEYQPIAREGEEAGVLEPSMLFPDDRIFRDFRFGKNMHLVLSDYRSFRPDHLVPESAWPGTIAVDEPGVRAVLAAREAAGRLPEGTTAATAFDEGGYVPYVDLSDAAQVDRQRAARVILAALYEASDVAGDRAAMLADDATAGPVDAAVLNALIEDHRAMLPADLMGLTAIDTADPTLLRGISYFALGKRSLVGSIGARYLVVARHLDVVSEHRDATRREDVYGEAQRTWIASAMDANADATWTVFGSSVSFAPLLLDVRMFATRLPEGFPAEVFYLNADHWDGFPVEKERMLAMLRRRNALLLSGDIHACYVTDHGADPDGNRAVEVTTPGVSSSSFRGLLYGSAQQLDSLRGNPTVDAVLDLLDLLMQMSRPNLIHSQSDVNGLVLVRLDGTEVLADVWQLPSSAPLTNFEDRPADLASMWVHARYRAAKTGAQTGAIEPVAL